MTFQCQFSKIIATQDPNTGELVPLTKMVRDETYPFVPSLDMVFLGDRSFAEQVTGVIWNGSAGRFDLPTAPYVAEHGEQVSALVYALIHEAGWSSEVSLEGDETF